MGMFDYVNYNGEVLQTKEFDCQMKNYWITDGRLIESVGAYHGVPKEKRMHPDAPEESILSFAGCIEWIETEKRDMNYHGILKAGGKLFKFTDGNLVSVTDEE